MSAEVLSMTDLFHRYGTEGLPTHYLLDSGESYCVDTTYRQDFWEGYCHLLLSKKKLVHYLAEAPATDMPLVIFLDLRFLYRNLNDNQPIQYDFLEVCVSCLREIISEMLPVTQEHLYSVVCQTEGWKEGDKYCFTVRIQFPYIRVNARWQDTVFVPRVVEFLKKENLLSQLSSDSAYSVNQTVRSSSISTPLVVYGSCEKGAPPTELVAAFAPDGEQVSLDKFFDIEQHHFSKTGAFNPSAFSDYSAKELLPLMLSVEFCSTSIVPKERVSSEESHSIEVRDTDDLGEEEALFFLHAIKKSRGGEDYCWKDIGRAIYNIWEGSAEGFNIFAQFSRGNRDSDECMTLWTKELQKRVGPSQYVGIKTLAWYARKDNPERYNQWHRSWVHKALERAIRAPTEHVVISESVYRMFWLDFICSAEPATWYSFVNHRWKRSMKGSALGKKISKDMLMKLASYKDALKRNISKAEEEMKEKYKKAKKGVNLLCKNLGQLPFRNKVVDACCERFEPEDFDFEKICDTNPLLMGMENGVHEICGKHAYFRPGKPEDYLTMTTRIDWKDYDTLTPSGNGFEHPEVIEVLEYLRKVLPLKPVRDWTVEDLAACLKGRNYRKLLRCLEGKKGNNSKSKLIMILQRALGDYCADANAAMLTDRPPEAGKPVPYLTDIDKAHIAIIHETEDELCFRAGMIKRLTGGDRLSGRDLYEKGSRAFHMFWNLYVVCNQVAPIPAVDQAVINRLVIVPFIAEFMKQDDLNKAEQEGRKTDFMFLADENFEEKIPDMAQAFFWVLSKNFHNSQINQAVPEDIAQATKDYWKESDPCQMFVNSMMRRAIIVTEDGREVVDKKSTVSFTALNKLYSKFFRDNFVTRERSDAVRIKNNFIRILGEQNRRGQWEGWQLIKEDREEDVLQ